MNTLESYITDNPSGKTEECAKFVIDDTLSPFVLHDVTTVGQKYTLAFWVRSDTECRVLTCGKTIQVTTEWTRHIISFTAKETNIEIYFQKTANYYIYHIKLEKGDKATEWELSVDDVNDRLDTTIADLHETTIEENAAILQSSRDIILEALGSYVQRDTGVHVVSVTNYYMATAESSDITIDMEGWTEELPTLSTNMPYLWTYEMLIYSDGSTNTLSPRSLATFESSALSIINEYYAVNSSSEEPIRIVETADDSGNVTQSEEELEWMTTIPGMSAIDLCLWHYEQIVLEDGTTIDTEPLFIGRYRHSFSEYMNDFETRMSVEVGEIKMSFEGTSQRLEEINGVVQETITKFDKCISFTENGIIISSGNEEGSVLSLQLDSEAGIIFSKDGVAFGTWDGVDFHTGNIIIDVEEKAQFGNFAFVPRSDNSLMFLKVGG